MHRILESLDTLRQIDCFLYEVFSLISKVLNLHDHVLPLFFGLVGSLLALFEFFYLHGEVLVLDENTLELLI